MSSRRRIDPGGLLAVAETLLEAATSAEPVSRDALLRRAVSSAYYAVFHALQGGVADRLLEGLSERDVEALNDRATRSLNHDAIEKLARRVAEKSNVSDRYRSILSDCQTFGKLHAARIEADYVASASFDRERVRALVDEARFTIEIENLRSGDGIHRLLVAELIIPPERRGKT